MKGDGCRRMTNFITWMTLICFYTMCFIAFIQVIARYAFSSAMSWPEEANFYLFICISYLGMSLCMENKSHLRIDAILNYIPKKISWVLDLIVYFMDVVFSVILIVFGSYMALDVWDMGQMTVSFPLPVWVVVALIPLIAISMAIYSLRNLYAAWKCSSR